MQSSFRSRGLLILLLLTLAVASFGCGSVDRATREQQFTEHFEALLPGGRVLSNDLARDEEVELIGAWIFDREFLVEDEDGRILSIDRGNLAPNWAFERLHGRLEFPPAATPVSFLMISDGDLFEVSRNHGNLMHGAIPLSFVASAAPTGSDSTAYVPTLAAPEAKATLITVNLANGIEGWRIATRSSISSAPAFGGTSTRPMIYFAEESGVVYAYEAASSVLGAPAPAWMRVTHGGIHHTPVVLDDLVLVGSDYGDFWALNRVTGRVEWSVMSGSAILGRPAAAGDQVYFTNARGFHAYDRTEGLHRWTYERPGHFICRRPEAVYVQVAPGVLNALDVKTGEMLREFDFGEETHFLPNMKDGVLYAVTEDGFLFLVDVPLS